LTRHIILLFKKTNFKTEKRGGINNPIQNQYTN
jgi:hypothetical protein